MPKWSLSYGEPKSDVDVTSRGARHLNLALAIAGTLLVVCAAVVAVSGAVRVSFGSTLVSVASPFRPLAQGLALLLLREALDNDVDHRSRLRFLGLFGALLGSLCLESRPRIVGDGNEYLAMAWNLSEGRPPAPTWQEYERLKTLLSPALDPYPFVVLEPPGPGGRYSFYHSWAYSLLAAPFLRVASATGLPLLVGFTALNALLLLLAAAFLFDRVGSRVCLLVLGGSGLWWVDKPHPELLVMCVLLVAVAALPDKPGLSLTLQGLAGLQYPVFGVALLASAAWLAWRGRLREPRARGGFVAGALLLLAAPASNLVLSVQAVPLSRTVVFHVPNLAEWTAVLVDPNLGLAFGWPALALATALGFVVMVRARTLAIDTAVAFVLVAGLLLIVVAWPHNLNHGGTRGMSRYALWLVPLCLPLIRPLERVPHGRTLLVALAAGSLAMGLGDYNPRMDERHLSPSVAADWLWRNWPGADNPLPEVFAERTTGVDGERALPAATEGCEKALVVGDGTPQAVWPLWCRPQEMPPQCRAEGAFCYANRRGSTYAFVPAPRQPGFDFFRPRAWYWKGTPSDELARFLAQFTRKRVWTADPEKDQDLYADKGRLGPRQARINRESMLLWLTEPKEGAWIALKPVPRHRALFIDPQQARVLESVVIDPTVPTRLAVPAVAPLLLVVAPEPLVPADSPAGG